jgi:hypothetical protein
MNEFRIMGRYKAGYVTKRRLRKLDVNHCQALTSISKEYFGTSK